VTTYATVEQLAAAPWGLAPPDAARLLVRASEVIDQALRTAIYDVDAITGAPTEAAVIQVLADATCAQVEFWETGDEEDDILGPVAGHLPGWDADPVRRFGGCERRSCGADVFGAAGAPDPGQRWFA